MIVYLAKAVNFLALFLQNTITFVSSIGHVIVLLLTTAFTTVYNIVKNILIFFQIIYEDNLTLFTDDLPNSAGNIYNAICYQWFNMCKSVSAVTNDLFTEITAIFNKLQLSFFTLFSIISEVLLILMKGIVLLGDTLWLLITFIPVHLPYLVKAFFKYIKDYLVSNAIDAYMGLLRFTNFLTEVPLESFMGIITAMIIARSCIHFREVIYSNVSDWYWIIVRKVTYIYYMVYNYCTNSEVRTIASLVGGQPLVTRHSDIDLINDNYEDPANHADALCVICQERQKCVLTLPCRHVCLCSECCMRLYAYQRTCPICRTFIYHSVNVYL